MTYKKRSLKFQFTLKSGAFDEAGNDVITIDNIKAEIQVGAYGGITGTSLEARVFGLGMDRMSLLSYKGIQFNGAKQNMIKIWADDAPIFFGAITNCFADMNQMPDAPLIISAFATGFDQSIPAPPFSGRGDVSVVDIITSIAKTIDYTVINSGVNSHLPNPYFEGNPISQIQQCAQAGGINVDFRLGFIYMWPQGGSADDVMPFVSPENGLIGYPVFSNNGLNFSCQYSNLIIRGRKVKIETTLPNASGIYTIQSATHYLSSWAEGAPWMTIAYASIGELTEVRQ